MAGDLSIDHRLDIVEGGVGAPIRVNTSGVFDIMFRSVPSLLSEVQSSDKGEGIVDNHDFLMMGCSKGMLAVLTKMNARMRAPAQLHNGQRFPVQRINHGEIPNKNICLKLIGRRDYVIQEVAEPRRGVSRPRVPEQLYLAVDVPPGDID